MSIYDFVGVYAFNLPQAGFLARASELTDSNSTTRVSGLVTKERYDIRGKTIQINVTEFDGNVGEIQLYIGLTKQTHENPFFENDWWRILKYNYGINKWYVQRCRNGSIDIIKNGNIASFSGSLKIKVDEQGNLINIYENNIIRYNGTYGLSSTFIYIYLLSSTDIMNKNITLGSDSIDNFKFDLFNDDFHDDIIGSEWELIEQNGGYVYEQDGHLNLISDRMSFLNVKEEPLYEIDRLMEFKEKYDEVNSLYVHNKKLYFSVAQLSYKGSGVLGSLDLVDYNVDFILNSTGERFTHWDCLYFNESIRWFGQWTNATADTIPSDYVFLNPSNGRTDYGRLPYTNDCNEFVSSTSWNNSIYIGERISGGYNISATYPNGGGLWRYNGTFKRIWENPKNLEVYSLIAYKDKLYIFLSTTWGSRYKAAEIWTYDGREFNLIQNLTSQSVSFGGGAKIYKGVLVIGGNDADGHGRIFFSTDGTHFKSVSVDSYFEDLHILSISDMIINPISDELIMSATTMIEKSEVKRTRGSYLLLSTSDLSHFKQFTHQKDGLVIGHHGCALVFYDESIYIAVHLTDKGCTIDKLMLAIGSVEVHAITVNGSNLKDVTIDTFKTKKDGKLNISIFSSMKHVEALIPEGYVLVYIQNAKSYYVKESKIYFIPNLENGSDNIILMFQSLPITCPLILNSTIEIKNYIWNDSEKYIDIYAYQAPKVGMITINASRYGAAIEAINAREFSQEGDIITVYTEPSSELESIRLMFEIEGVPYLRISMTNQTQMSGVDWDPIYRCLKIRLRTNRSFMLQVLCGDYGAPQVVYKEGVPFDAWIYSVDERILTLGLIGGDLYFDIYFYLEDVRYAPLLDVKRIYEAGNGYIETNSIIVYEDSLFFSLAQLPPKGSGVIGRIDLEKYTVDVLENTSGARFTHWNNVYFNDSIRWFGQWYDNNSDIMRADFEFYHTSNGTLKHERILHTDDCNELVSSTVWNGDLFIGERIIGGTTSNSIYPNGGGLWKYNGTFTRIWENPNHLEVWSLISYDSKLYIFLSDPSYISSIYATEIWTYDGSNFILVANLTSNSISLEGGVEIFNDMLVIGGRDNTGRGVLIYSSDGINFNIIAVNSFGSELEIKCISDLYPLDKCDELILAAVKEEGLEATVKSGWKYALFHTPDLKNFYQLTNEKDGALYGCHGNNIDLRESKLFVGVLSTNIGSAIDEVDLPIHQIGVHLLTAKDYVLPNVKVGDAETDSRGHVKITFLDTENFFFKIVNPVEYFPYCVINASKFSFKGSHLEVKPEMSKESTEIFVLYFNSSIPQPYILKSTTKIINSGWDSSLRKFSFTIDDKKEENVTLKLNLADKFPNGFVTRCNRRKWGQSYDSTAQILTIWIILNSRAQVVIEALPGPKANYTRVSLQILAIVVIPIIFIITYYLKRHRF